MRGRRTVWGGRSRVKAALYKGTLVATRYNPVTRVFYQSPLADGKAKKVALVRLHAQSADHTQWHGEVRSALGSSNGCTLTYSQLL